MAPPPSSTPSRGPSKSLSYPHRALKDNQKRLSLNSNRSNTGWNPSRPTSLVAVSPHIISISPSPEHRTAAASDSNAFLTTLAAQERRVLELKEELQKSEGDLQRLKDQWTARETTKKRSDMRQVELVRPFSSPTKSNWADLDEVRAGREDERRRAMYVRTKHPERKVLEGRHTRALSLLSPASLATRREPPLPGEEERARTADASRYAVRPERHGAPRSSRAVAGDDLVSSGRQFMGDLRMGLWTFIDDLRQATVGDEALRSPTRRDVKDPSAYTRIVSGTRPGANSNRRSMPPRRKPDTLLPPAPFATATATGPSAPARPETPTGTVQQRSEPGKETDDHGWDNWDSPPPKTTTSPCFSATAGSSPRTSMSSDIKDKDKDKAPGSGLDPLLPPWPGLAKLSPGNLTRTASNLMREWERSLTSSPAADARKGRSPSPGKEKET